MLVAVRYGIPAVLVVAGLVVLLVGPEGGNLEGWALFTGAGLSVLLLNVLHRTGVAGDRERTREQDARSYFDAHGRWPDEREAPAEQEAPAGQPPVERQPLEQPPREPADPDRYGPPPIERPPPKLRRPPRRRGE